MSVIAKRKTGQIDDLRLQSLNTNQRLQTREGALDEYKRFILAIESGSFEQVDRLITAGLNTHRGVHGLIELYDRAAQGLYHPKGYQEKTNSLCVWEKLMVCGGT